MIFQTGLLQKQCENWFNLFSTFQPTTIATTDFEMFINRDLIGLTQTTDLILDFFANKIHAQCSTRTCTAHGAKRAVTSGREACTFGPRSRGACCKGTLPPPLLPPVPRPPNPLQPQSGERSCLVQQSRGCRTVRSCERGVSR